jgi:hypothetical protein
MKACHCSELLPTLLEAMGWPSPTEILPASNYEVIKAPKTDGRSRFSRPALRLIRALILSGEKPSEFQRRLRARDAALLAEVGVAFPQRPARSRLSRPRRGT